LLPRREATAIGLIVNELIMNCYKYAFPDERAGTIAVNLRTDEATACLSVMMALDAPQRSRKEWEQGVGCAACTSTGRHGATNGCGWRQLRCDCHLPTYICAA
jgi:two-component sensor histidine kinase